MSANCLCWVNRVVLAARRSLPVCPRKQTISETSRHFAFVENAATARVVLCGHSHRQSVIHGPSGCLILNPGSVGCPVFADIPFAANLEHRSPHARYAVLTRSNGSWRVEL